MKLWTIHVSQFWTCLQEQGVLSCDQDMVDEDWLPAYRWLVNQMEKRIGSRPHERAFPLWAWYQYNNERRRKPDLRCGAHLPRGERGVRIELEIADHLVLLSDFQLWHHVLNFWYIPESREDAERFEAEAEGHGFSDVSLPSEHPNFHKRIVESWQRIFDLDWMDEEHYISCARKDKQIQATFWRLYLSDVKDVTFFTAR